MPENLQDHHLSESWGAAMERLGTAWCELAHDTPMWPVHGQYECRTCGRHYPVPWGETQPLVAAAARVRPLRVSSALLPAMLLVALFAASPARGAEPMLAATAVGPEMAFARYIARQQQTAPWNVETVEIEASLPKLEKSGTMRAIRRLTTKGEPEYQMVDIAGDSTVKHQVIVRYLTADIHAATMPPSSVAITPANYKFHYKGAVANGGATAYIFQITPRKKREGLIKGELWLDAGTGVVVRQSGYLVKRPSVFVKRVEIDRETTLRDGVAESKVTHWAIDTRLVGRAEVTVRERPWSDAEAAPVPTFIGAN